MKCTTENFISRLKKKKEDALTFIIDAYMPLVKTIVTKILYAIKPDAIDECINDVFLLVWNNSYQFKGERDEFKKWIGMIAKTKAIDRYRHAEKHRLREQSVHCLAEQASSVMTETSILYSEEKDALLSALSQLGEVDSEIFILKYYFELSNTEIAMQLQMTKAAVDNRLYRGKKTLATNKKLKELFL